MRGHELRCAPPKPHRDAICLKIPQALASHGLHAIRQQEVPLLPKKGAEFDPATLDSWKEADPDVPNLKQAKAEYAKLQ